MWGRQLGWAGVLGLCFHKRFIGSAESRGAIVIIVQLKGGLGNQLFQYAAGRRLSLTVGVPLKLGVAEV